MLEGTTPRSRHAALADRKGVVPRESPCGLGMKGDRGGCPSGNPNGGSRGWFQHMGIDPPNPKWNAAQTQDWGDGFEPS